MTEQEVQVLATRLERIWEPQPKPPRERSVKWRLVNGGLTFFMAVSPAIYFSAGGQSSLALSLIRRQTDEQSPGLRWEDGPLTGWLYCAESEFIRTIHPRVDALPRQYFDQFESQWLPFFRRGCWLCGYDIEASAHEKAEWVHGFSREELKAWNLKI